MAIRKATEADLDNLTWIHMAAFESTPVFGYRYPYRNQYPEEHEKFTRIRFAETLMAPDREILVWECNSIEDESVTKPVAFALWERFDTTRSLNLDRMDRRDASPARVAAFRAEIAKARAEFFDKKYHNDQFYLQLLACHPDYQRRGAGQALLRWGIEKAEGDGKQAVTLVSSAVGEPLYRRFGFEVVGSFRTQVEGEEEYLDTTAMELKINK